MQLPDKDQGNQVGVLEGYCSMHSELYLETNLRTYRFYP